MAAGAAGGSSVLAASTRLAFEMFSRARKAIARVFVPTLDLYPDGALTIENVTVTHSTTSAVQQCIFPCDGYAVGVTVSCQGKSDGTSPTNADLASLKLAIIINGSTNVFQVGQQGQGFVAFSQLQGSQSGIFRLMFPIKQRTPTVIQIKSQTPTNDLICDVTIWYVNTSNPPLTD